MHNGMNDLVNDAALIEIREEEAKQEWISAIQNPPRKKTKTISNLHNGHCAGLWSNYQAAKLERVDFSRSLANIAC